MYTIEKICWTGFVRNEEVIHKIKEDRNIVRIITRKNGNLIGHNVRGKFLVK
jgi:hypothetical protein